MHESIWNSKQLVQLYSFFHCLIVVMAWSILCQQLDLKYVENEKYSIGIHSKSLKQHFALILRKLCHGSEGVVKRCCSTLVDETVVKREDRKI